MRFDLIVVLMLAFSGADAAGSSAASPLANSTDGEAASAADGSTEQATRSGYDVIEQFGSAEGVAGQLKQSDAAVETRFDSSFLDDRLEPYFNWKGRLKKDYGLAYGLNFWLLGQHASDTLPDRRDSALGGIFRFQGLWTFFGRGRSNQGRIEWRLERRSSIGNAIAPDTLGRNVGIYSIDTGWPYREDFAWDLNVVNYTQGFNNGRAGFAVGRLAFDVYLDANAFQGVNGGFMNRGLWLSPALPTTGVGALGAVAEWSITEQVRVGVQLYDANAQNGDFDLDTFREHEFIRALEIGWSPDVARPKTDRIKFTLSARAGSVAGYGLAVSATWQFANWMPFLRYGTNNAGGNVRAEQYAAAGFRLQTDFDEKLNAGVAWSKPVRDELGAPTRRSSEYVLEASYDYALSSHLTLTPDVQLALDPADNPAEDRVWVLGLKVTLSL